MPDSLRDLLAILCRMPSEPAGVEPLGSFHHNGDESAPPSQEGGRGVLCLHGRLWAAWYMVRPLSEEASALDGRSSDLAEVCAAEGDPG